MCVLGGDITLLYTIVGEDGGYEQPASYLASQPPKYPGVATNQRRYRWLVVSYMYYLPTRLIAGN